MLVSGFVNSLISFTLWEKPLRDNSTVQFITVCSVEEEKTEHFEI